MNTHGFGKELGRRPAWVEYARATPGRLAGEQPLPPLERETMSKPPIWHKNNVGFWLAVCVLISVAFSVIYRAMH
jgi:hypothetical protein